jgi:hypothetical protein
MPALSRYLLLYNATTLGLSVPQDHLNLSMKIRTLSGIKSNNSIKLNLAFYRIEPSFRVGN